MDDDTSAVSRKFGLKPDWNPTTEDIEHQKFLNVLHDVKGLYNRKKLSFFEITPRSFIQLLVGIGGWLIDGKYYRKNICVRGLGRKIFGVGQG